MRLPSPRASLSPRARPEAGFVRDAAFPRVYPPEGSLKNQALLGLSSRFPFSLVLLQLHR